MNNQAIGKKFYKAKLVAQEEGLMVAFDEFTTVKETECFYFVVPAIHHGAYTLFMNPGKFASKEVKKDGIAKAKKMIKRVSKGRSRIAKKSKELAVQELVMRKRRQIRYLLRDLEFCRAFTDKVESINDLTSTSSFDSNRWLMVPDTSELVNGHFVFD